MESTNTEKCDTKDLSILPVHAEDMAPTEMLIEPYGPSGMFPLSPFLLYAHLR